MKACVGWPLFPAGCAIALAFVIVAAPRTRTSFCGGSKADIARLTVAQLAYEAFPQWSAEHPKARCPANLEALLPWTNATEVIDPWGRDYRFFCVVQPGRSAYIVAWSAGQDRHHGTDDDIRSDQ